MNAYEFHLFPGTVLPRDNGFEVLSALSRKFPWLHGRPDIQIAPIRGTRLADDHSQIRTDRNSVLHIRGLTPEQATDIGGNWIVLETRVLAIDTGSLVQLEPFTYLVSRCVVFPDVFDDLTAMAKVLAEAGDGAQAHVGKPRVVPCQEYNSQSHNRRNL